MIRTVLATRYAQPLRQGSSLPALMEADDGCLYVVKFVGAGQGSKALIAELVAGEIGRALGLPVPEIVLMTLEPTLGPSEPDPEICELLEASVGLNLGLRFLPHAFTYNPLMTPPPDPLLASRIVWFDAYVTNVDRTPRNVNLLLWEQQLWLIDHGASLYFHHSWRNPVAQSRSPFALIRDHTLLSFASQLPKADLALRPMLPEELLREIVAQIPEAWLRGEKAFASTDEHREAYVSYLLSRLESSAIFVEEALRAHAASL